MVFVSMIRYEGFVANRGGHIVNVWFDCGPIVCQYMPCRVVDGQAIFEFEGVEFEIPAIDGRTWTQWKSRLV